MRPIKGSALGQEIKGNAKANVPTMIWGAPGIGKSEIVYQVAQELGAALFEIHRLDEIIGDNFHDAMWNTISERDIDYDFEVSDEDILSIKEQLKRIL